MWNTVAPDYFRTLRIPLASGRAFEGRDDEAGAPVAIVNTTLAERFWHDAASALNRSTAPCAAPAAPACLSAS